ncbi:MAG: AtpZ/AtpI family protein [Candidatus Eisenbacteria bacterium]|nr:AtpZ/AtpI family protein [Candidatus Eisenbacteria bacterium]
MTLSSRSLTMAGTQMLASVLIGSLLGRTLDARWHSAPWCFVAGFVLGASAGFWDLYRAVRS